MLTALITLAAAAGTLVLVLLAVVVAAIRREAPNAKLSSQAPDLMAGLVRRLLGVGVRRPDPAYEQPEEYVAGHTFGHGQEGGSV